MQGRGKRCIQKGYGSVSRMLPTLFSKETDGFRE
jgi:hypothetical protein